MSGHDRCQGQLMILIVAVACAGCIRESVDSLCRDGADARIT